jgi:hypothetical protein
MSMEHDKSVFMFLLFCLRDQCSLNSLSQRMCRVQLDEQANRDVDEMVDGATLQDYLLFAADWAKDYKAADADVAQHSDKSKELASVDKVSLQSPSALNIRRFMFQHSILAI